MLVVRSATRDASQSGAAAAECSFTRRQRCSVEAVALERWVLHAPTAAAAMSCADKLAKRPEVLWIEKAALVCFWLVTHDAMPCCCILRHMDWVGLGWMCWTCGRGCLALRCVASCYIVVCCVVVRCVVLCCVVLRCVVLCWTWVWLDVLNLGLVG